MTKALQWMPRAYGPARGVALGLSVQVQLRPGSEVRRVEQMEQGPARRPALPTVSLAAAGAAAVSLAVVAVPWLRMSVEAPSLRVALETGGSLLAVTTVTLLARQCGFRWQTCCT